MTGPLKPRAFVVIELPRLDLSGGEPQYDAVPRLRRSQRGEPSKMRLQDFSQVDGAKAPSSRIRLLPGMSPLRRSQR